MNIGYARVSTQDQTLNLQKDALEPVQNLSEILFIYGLFLELSCYPSEWAKTVICPYIACLSTGTKKILNRF